MGVSGIIVDFGISLDNNLIYDTEIGSTGGLVVLAGQGLSNCLREELG